ncbi:MAG: hypothetical protein DMD85_03745 [Candidatus Rokuibacteriota bacterium]|nr:MAG: hypothetical protein DMD85_03745 [Candidatus Rokubacteria bacterium]
MNLRNCSRYVVIAFAVTVVTGLGVRDAVAKPYACGNKTCSTHPTKSNCQVCKSAVCDLNNKGQEVLVPGTATTTTCTEPAKVETPPATPPSKVPTTRAPVERPVAR